MRTTTETTSNFVKLARTKIYGKKKYRDQNQKSSTLRGLTLNHKKGYFYFLMSCDIKNLYLILRGSADMAIH